MQENIKAVLTTIGFIAYFTLLPLFWVWEYLRIGLSFLSDWQWFSITIYLMNTVLAIKIPRWYFPYFFDKSGEKEDLSPAERMVRDEVGKEFVERFSGLAPTITGDVHIPTHDDTVSVKIKGSTATNLYEHLFPNAKDKKSSMVDCIILLREVSVDSPIIYIVSFLKGSPLGGSTKTTEVGTIDNYKKLEDFLRDMNLLDVI